MTDLFKPDVPQEDPALKKMQEDEQHRAEAARLRATQDQLTLATQIRGAKYGTRSLLGSFGSGGGSLLGSG